MKIQINKDLLTEYKDTIWKGFTAKELFCLATGGAISVAVVVVLHKAFGMYPATAIYLAVPFAIPAILMGFFKFQGYLSVFDLVREYFFSRRCRELIYEAEEEPGTIVFTLKKRPETKQPKRRKDKNDGIHDQSGKALS